MRLPSVTTSLQGFGLPSEVHSQGIRVAFPPSATLYRGVIPATPLRLRFDIGIIAHSLQFVKAFMQFSAIIPAFFCLQANGFYFTKKPSYVISAELKYEGFSFN